MFVQRKQYILWTLTVISGIFVCYYSFFDENVPQKIELSQTHRVYKKTAKADFLLDTPGCQIPNYAKKYYYRRIVPKPKDSPNTVCGKRAVFVKAIDNNQITFVINEKIMKRYYAKSYTCCYKFAMRSSLPGHENDALDYTKCSNFKSGTTVKFWEEIIIVVCNKNINKSGLHSNTVYEDAYIILKKKDIKKNLKAPFWNILMVGLDTMSRNRFYDTMPHTVKYFHENRWLDYTGYHKVGYNTFPNLMSVLTGLDISTVNAKCRTGLFKCVDYFIWNKFKQAGYTTSYGEDNLKCPDTFSLKGFKTKPTDHYMRTFFLTGEKSVGHVVCTKKQPSATHLLHYARSFATSYKDDGFFGLFWINSYTHDHRGNPSILDAELKTFFKKLYTSNVLNNTFVIVFSDHGTRFGSKRLPMESYYDERLPMLFVWTPMDFRRLHTDKYYNSHVNQARLITPYDLHLTLAEILKLSTNSTNETKAQGCPKCTSLFEIKSPYRTCAHANIDAQWCSCHNMSFVSGKANSTQKGLSLSIQYLENIQKNIKTLPCTSCIKFKRPEVFRSHEYYYAEKKYNVMAFIMSPHEVIYESVIATSGNTSEVLQLYTISSYNIKGNCVINPNHRGFCICEYHSCAAKKG